MTSETIQFDCPQCGRVCGFKACYAGRTARCLNCDSRFIIPKQTGLSAVPCPAVPVEPLPGFYKSATKDSLKAFGHSDSVVGIVFCGVLLVAQFILGDIDLSIPLPGFYLLLPLGWIVTFVASGCFAWYSMEIIAAGRIGTDSLPPVEPGSGLDFIWLVLKSCYLIFVTFIIALLPASFLSAWFESFGIHIGAFYYLAAFLCLLLWPLDLAILSLGIPVWRIFRYDLIVGAIARTFLPYMFTAIMTLIALSLLWAGIARFATSEGLSFWGIAGLLLLRLGGGMMFLFAMRVIGLYCLHYAEVCPELWAVSKPRSHDEV